MSHVDVGMFGTVWSEIGIPENLRGCAVGCMKDARHCAGLKTGINFSVIKT